MNEKDIEALKEWLYDHCYYAGNSEVAKTLRELADWYDDELKESEDERIRKELIDYINRLTASPNNIDKYNTWLAWLEKQGEQHPPIDIDKAELPFRRLCMVDVFTHTEPKFKVGDWVVKQDGESFWNGDCVAQITNITDCGEHWLNTGCWVEARDIRLWTINDAKDGDLIYVSTETKGIQAIFHKFENGIIYFHCNLCSDFAQGGYEPSGDVKSVNPLLREQYQSFFQKMKQAGYEWDAEKKELKKIEVASKENEDNRIRKGIIRNLQYLMDKSEGFVKKDLAERIAWLEKQGKNVQPDIPEDGQLLNSLTDVGKRVFLDRPVTLRAAIDWLASQCKQECSVCSKILNNGETMNEKDIEELKKWLCDRGYYVGNSEVVKSLRKLADEFDD